MVTQHIIKTTKEKYYTLKRSTGTFGELRICRNKAANIVIKWQRLCAITYTVSIFKDLFFRFYLRSNVCCCKH